MQPFHVKEMKPHQDEMHDTNKKTFKTFKNKKAVQIFVYQVLRCCMLSIFFANFMRVGDSMEPLKLL